jgi:hypothetical protein
MNYDEAIQVYDTMDELQRSGVSIRLYAIAKRVPGGTPAKEVLRLAIVEEVERFPLP